MSWISGNH